MAWPLNVVAESTIFRGKKSGGRNHAEQSEQHKSQIYKKHESTRDKELNGTKIKKSIEEFGAGKRQSKTSTYYHFPTTATCQSRGRNPNPINRPPLGIVMTSPFGGGLFRET